jgi:hypothetical protein
MSNYGNADKSTKYGTVTIRNPGRFSAPPNIQTLRRVAGKDAIHGCVYTKSAGNVELQGPALRAFREAEYLATPARLRRKGKVVPIILTGVGYRSYVTQRSLYYGPSNTNGTRFADPDGSLHCEALAVDCNTGFLAILAGIRAKKALIKVGFVFGVPGEGWHASFGFVG